MIGSHLTRFSCEGPHARMRHVGVALLSVVAELVDLRLLFANLFCRTRSMWSRGCAGFSTNVSEWSPTNSSYLDFVRCRNCSLACSSRFPARRRNCRQSLSLWPVSKNVHAAPGTRPGTPSHERRRTKHKRTKIPRSSLNPGKHMT